MSTTPGMVWQNLRAANAANTSTSFQWSNPGLMPGNPPAVAMAVGDQLKAGLLTIGSTSTVYPFTASCAAGSSEFSVASNLGDLKVGMPVVCATPGVLQAGVVILNVDEPSSPYIVLGGGYGPWAYNVINNPWIYSMPAGQALTTGETLYAIDQFPYGTLAATVTPSTGVTIEDWNMDGSSTNPGPTTGNGSSMSNSGGQAMADFGVTFAAAGVFTLEVAYTSSDPDYANTSTSTTVVVS